MREAPAAASQHGGSSQLSMAAYARTTTAEACPPIGTGSVSGGRSSARSGTREVVRMMATLRCALALVALAALPPTLSCAQVENQRSIGLMLGDPVAVSYREPITDSTFLDIKAGVWTWHFWHEPIVYDVPFVSADHSWLLSSGESKHNLSVGAGIALFMDDSPKDGKPSDVVAALRVPVGTEVHSRGELSLGVELAPILQFAPWYTGGRYGIELNGGVVLRYAY
jgi:hypothetical protein